MLACRCSDRLTRAGEIARLLGTDRMRTARWAFHIFAAVASQPRKCAMLIAMQLQQHICVTRRGRGCREIVELWHMCGVVTKFAQRPRVAVGPSTCVDGTTVHVCEDVGGARAWEDRMGHTVTAARVVGQWEC